MPKKIAILQSNYIPWKGYFDIIHMVDVFIFYDDVQFTKNDWRNRNKIKTPKGSQWLSIPCGTNPNRLICDVEIKDHDWQRKHWDIIRQNYKTAPHFHQYRELFEEFYLGSRWTNLSELNHHLIKCVSHHILGITTLFDDSRNYSLTGTKGDRVMDLLDKVEASEYLSGPSARDYLNENAFAERNIQLSYIDYSEYPEYHQLYPPFIHEVSIIDLIFNEGSNAVRYLKSFNKDINEPFFTEVKVRELDKGF